MTDGEHRRELMSNNGFGLLCVATVPKAITQLGGLGISRRRYEPELR
jgi:hypothetical protein